MKHAFPLLCLILSMSVRGDELPRISLWPERMPQPKAIASEPERVDRSSAGPEGFALRKNITDPRIVVYQAASDKATGAACIVVPGGGFGILADEHEGSELCTWFAARGITAFLLQHRCPTNTHTEPNTGPVQDCQRAMMLIKEHADEFKVDRTKIGLFGFSAGGQVALVAATNGTFFATNGAVHDHRPAFIMLLYPWRIYDEKTKGLRSDVHITGPLPPLFVAQAADDTSSNPLGSTQLYLAALQARSKEKPNPSEMHIYATGGHGFGMRPAKDGTPCATDWPARAAAWLASQGLTK